MKTNKAIGLVGIDDQKQYPRNNACQLSKRPCCIGLQTCGGDRRTHDLGSLRNTWGKHRHRQKRLRMFDRNS